MNSSSLSITISRLASIWQWQHVWHTFSHTKYSCAHLVDFIFFRSSGRRIGLPLSPPVATRHCSTESSDECTHHKCSSKKNCNRLSLAETHARASIWFLSHVFQVKVERQNVKIKRNRTSMDTKDSQKEMNCRSLNRVRVRVMQYVTENEQ